MAKSYFPPRIPNNMKLLIDTSALALNDYLRLYKPADDRKCSVDYMKNDISRLEELSSRLSETNNWFVLEELLIEFGNSIDAFKWVSKKAQTNRTKKIFARAAKQRIRVLKFLKERNRIIRLDSALVCLANQYTPRVREIFEEIARKKTNREVDTKLILSALAYANYEPVCTFANDMDLIKTLVVSCKEFGLSHDSYVLTDRFLRKYQVKRLQVKKNVLKIKVNSYNTTPTLPHP